MEEEDLDSKYENVPSQIFYKELNAELKDRVNRQWEKLKDLIEEQPLLKDVCDKLEKNLKSLNANPQSEMLSKKHCYDINYWLFDNVHNKLNIKEEDPLFYNIIDSVHSVWRDINESLPDKTHICKPDSTLMDMPVLKEFKHLFDFIENFAFFKAEAFKDTPKACTKYFKYLERSVQIYYAREIFCTNPESNMCNRYIDNYKSYNPKNVREELNVSKLIMGLVWYQCYRDVFTPLGRQMLRARALLKKKLKTNISYEDIILLNGSSESIFSGSSSDSSYIVGYQASSQSSSG
ncbi:Plasmodium vivax Vir protein, putative [Plasmodium vivax]|uniref:Vir protein, putative n=1 Tax=Plasmodium vivax TaxID=5855 RepID=A0A1G4HEZ8_PLAVI|nr:Plasmodium vivax Vir protein, putative [Plasmodium vivax]